MAQMTDQYTLPDQTTPEVRPLYPMVALIILDGFGCAPRSSGNAISQAQMPFLKQAIQEYPHTFLQAGGEAVGLPWGEMGNSEVGHMNLGMGRIAYQELPRINNAIRDGSFFQNGALLHAIEHVKKNNSALHVVGLLSNGAIHGLDEHIYQMLALAKSQGMQKVFVHAILDGRDTPPKAGIEFIQRFYHETERIGVGTLATFGGRYYYMDRDNRWDRIEKAYNAMVYGLGPRTQDPRQYIQQMYQEGKTDEDMLPTVVVGQTQAPEALVKSNDAIVFCNFRTDRARQLTEAFTVPGFEKFERKGQLQNLVFVTMVEYEKGLPVEIAFPPISSENTLAKVLSDAGLRQVHIAETEKFAHVTNFFDGALGTVYPNEDFILVPSPQVATYDLQPEMSSFEITSKAVQAMTKGIYQFLVINYANPDMVGHTGNLQATIAALEAVDKNLQELITTITSVGGICIITGDHGNAEEKINSETGEVSKEHTANPVPFILIAENLRSPLKNPEAALDPLQLQAMGVLSDVAPTILQLFGIPQPKEMTGQSLLQLFFQTNSPKEEYV